MFTLNHLLPFEIDSQEYIDKFNNEATSTKGFNLKSQHNKYDERYPQIKPVVESKNLSKTDISAFIEYSPGATRFKLNLKSTDSDKKKLIDDSYVFNFKDKAINTSERAVVLMSLFRMLTIIALRDIKIFQTGYINIDGPEGYCVSIVKGNKYSRKIVSLNKSLKKIRMETYYDKIINKLFDKIFDYSDYKNPNFEFLDRIVFYLEPGCQIADVIRDAADRPFTRTGKVVYRETGAVDFNDTKHSSRISGKEGTRCTYYKLSKEYANEHQLNRHRNMDLYLDLITYYINNNFDVEKTLREYEYKRVEKPIPINFRTPNPDEAMYVEYVDSDTCPYADEPQVNGWSHTISFLHRRSMYLTIPLLRDILYNHDNIPIIAYTNSDKNALDKLWLLSRNTYRTFNVNNLADYYKRNTAYFNERIAQEYHMEVFTPEQQIIITEYKIKVIQEYNNIKNEYGNSLTRNEIFRLIDERIPQPNIKHIDPDPECMLHPSLWKRNG